MIKIKMILNPNDRKRLWLDYSKAEVDIIPSVKCVFSRQIIWVMLPEQLHSWMLDNNIWYNLEREIIEKYKSKWYIIFENELDAVLFRLTW